MFASRTKIAAGENATSATTAVAGPKTTVATDSYGAAIFAKLVEEFDVLKAKDVALTAKNEALTARVDALTSKESSLSAKVSALERKDHYTCETGFVLSWKADSGRQKTIRFARAFPRKPVIMFGLAGFSTEGDTAYINTVSDSYALSKESITKSSFDIYFYFPGFQWIKYMWIACA